MQIEFNEREKEVLIQKLKRYLDQELDVEIGQFDAEFVLDFISKEIGVYHYNRGLNDAQDIFKSRVESITDAIYELEIPTEFSGK
jgi:uncharacterized protein (DUF2164 family)